VGRQIFVCDSSLFNLRLSSDTGVGEEFHKVELDDLELFEVELRGKCRPGKISPIYILTFISI
jgi:hypothetical protein